MCYSKQSDGEDGEAATQFDRRVTSGFPSRERQLDSLSGSSPVQATHSPVH
jgi:hypothetical protein